MARTRKKTERTFETTYEEFRFSRCLESALAIFNGLENLTRYLFEIKDVEKRKSTMQFFRMTDLLEECQNLIDTFGPNSKTEFKISSPKQIDEFHREMNECMKKGSAK